MASLPLLLALTVLACCLAPLGQGLVALPRPSPGYRLLSISATEPAFWVPPEVVERLAGAHLSFMDITDFQDADPTLAPAAIAPFPSKPKFQEEVAEITRLLSAEVYEANLLAFSTTFSNRYYASNLGREASGWLFEKLQATAANRSDITVAQFEHHFKQPSIIVRIEGASRGQGAARDEREVVILGSHLDSIAPGMPMGSAPGADDNASGSMGVLEVLRVLVAADFRPRRPVELHWYAAEEIGLLGSQDIAKQYQASKVKVLAMMQLDMIGYTPHASEGKAPAVGIVTDNVDREASDFNRRLVEEYLSIGWEDTSCGYACSDFASWTRYGYRASFPFEAEFRDRNPMIHTVSDTLEMISIPHAMEFLKLALAYIVELGNHE